MPTLPLRDASRHPIPLDALLTAVDEQVAQGSRWLTLTDLGDAVPDTLTPLLTGILTRGAEPLLHATNALTDREQVRALVAAGLRALSVSLTDPHGPLSQLLRASSGLDHLRLELQVEDRDRAHADLESLVDLAAETGAVLRWNREPHAPQEPHDQVLTRIERIWQRCQDKGVRLHTTGFGLPALTPSPPAHASPVLDLNLIELLRQAVPLRPPQAGLLLTQDRLGRREPLPERLTQVLRLTRTAADTGGLLAAVGWPVRDLPLCLGGLGEGQPGSRCPTCPGEGACQGLIRQFEETPSPPAPCTGLRTLARDHGHEAPTVHLVLPYLADGVLVHGTLPGLAARLQAQGAEVVVHSAWHAPFNTAGPSLDLNAPVPVDTSAAQAEAKANQRAFAAGLDLTGADAVVVPGWLWGGAVLRHRTLPAHARVVLADLHLMQGIEAWKARHLPPGRRSIEGGWWPSERVHVHSCFPGLARLYWYAGVPMSQVHWLPYPTSAHACPPGPPPSTCRTIFSGGAHLRDHEVLLRAAERLPSDTHQIELHTPGRPTGQWPPVLRHVGTSPLPDFYEAIRTSRFVVVPLQHDPLKAAGISVIALARAAGRPVIATATASTLDHLRHEVDALLVPAGDADALAAAIARLDHDPALLDALGASALAHAATQDVERWAHTLLDGAPLGRVVQTRQGTFAPW